MKLLRIVVLAAIAWGCATNPATGRRQLILMSEQEEIGLGRSADADVRRQMGLYDDPQLQQYVDRIGQRLARQSFRPTLTWSFAVVDESAVNAFALPGGFIYVTRGILPFLRNEAELAGVLGHEIGHVDAKHSVDQYSKQILASGALAGGAILAPKWQAAFGAGGIAAQLVFLKFGRDAELEADRLGVGYASAGGWAPQAMQGVLGTLGRLDDAQGSRRGVPNWALTHPPAVDRVVKIQEAVTAAAARGGTATNVTEFERVIDRVVIGDSREKGMVRGSEFVHPVLRFSLRFPQGWNVMNGSDQVSAVESEQGRVAMVLQLAKTTTGSVAEIARADMKAEGLREVSGAATRINGLEAYVGTYEGQSGSAKILLRAGHIRAAQRVYLVAGLAAADEFPRVDGTFATAIQSFRELTQGEADRIQPSRLGFHVVRAGDTWESLSRQARDAGGLKASTLAIMNGADPATPPAVGSRVRIVVGG